MLGKRSKEALTLVAWTTWSEGEVDTDDSSPKWSRKRTSLVATLFPSSCDNSCSSCPVHSLSHAIAAPALFPSYSVSLIDNSSCLLSHVCLYFFMCISFSCAKPRFHVAPFRLIAHNTNYTPPMHTNHVNHHSRPKCNANMPLSV